MKKKIGLAALILLVVAQFIPVARDNPPVRSDFDGPAAVKRILRQSCYDCHSHATRWPWYTRIAPVSWWIAHHVDEGREELNFSDWGAYSRARRNELAVEIVDTVEKREMPPASYILLHGEAKLTGTEIKALRDWRP